MDPPTTSSAWQISGTFGSVPRPDLDDEFRFVLWLCLAIIVGMSILASMLSGKLW